MPSDILVAALALLAALAAAALAAAARRRLSAASAGTPPRVAGWPLLGAAPALGAHGADFLAACRARHGDAFSFPLLVGQPSMTWVFAPAALRFFFTAPESALVFAPAVEAFTQRVFGLTPADFTPPRHEAALAALRARLLPATLDEHAALLLPLLERGLAAAPWPQAGAGPSAATEFELAESIEALLFPAAVEALFGPALLAAHGARRLADVFQTFDRGFELAASPVPHLFQPAFCAARSALLAALRASLAAGHFEGSLAGGLLADSGLPRACQPSFLLSLLWALLANTLPAAFWATAFLLLPENAGELAAVRAAAAAGGVRAAACDRRAAPARAALEALRLRAPSIDVRVAAAAGAAVPAAGRVAAGGVVCISPWEAHLDARMWPGEVPPTAYCPARRGMNLAAAADGADARADGADDGADGLHAGAAGVGGLAGVAFGGGRWRCPGRPFAEMELAMVTALLASRFDMELIGGGAGAAGARRHPGDPHGLLPAPDMRRLVGVKVPLGPCRVRARLRGGGES
jgi:cytochrome P450